MYKNGRNFLQIQQSGAVEACWAHNPEVGGSKPLSATKNFLPRPLVTPVFEFIEV